MGEIIDRILSEERISFQEAIKELGIHMETLSVRKQQELLVDLCNAFLPYPTIS